MQLPIFGRVKKPTPWILGLVAAGLLGTTTAAYLAVRGTTRTKSFRSKRMALSRRCGKSISVPKSQAG